MQYFRAEWTFTVNLTQKLIVTSAPRKKPSYPIWILFPSTVRTTRRPRRRWHLKSFNSLPFFHRHWCCRGNLQLKSLPLFFTTVAKSQVCLTSFTGITQNTWGDPDPKLLRWYLFFQLPGLSFQVLPFTDYPRAPDTIPLHSFITSPRVNRI